MGFKSCNHCGMAIMSDQTGCPYCGADQGPVERFFVMAGNLFKVLFFGFMLVLLGYCALSLK